MDFDKGEEIKYPLQALLVADDLWMRIKIALGLKKITIMEGFRLYRPGDVMLCCHENSWALKAKITNVRHCLLKDVSEREWNAVGCTSQAEILKELPKYYEHLTMESRVTVIQWDNLEGILREGWVFKLDMTSNEIFNYIRAAWKEEYDKQMLKEDDTEKICIFLADRAVIELLSWPM